MALNFADAVAVRSVIRDRVTSACTQYAFYLLGLNTATAQQLAWAKGCMDNTPSMGERVSWYVINDANYLAEGSSITDQELQNAVQTAINNFFIAAA